jgi:hypothetical protein
LSGNSVFVCGCSYVQRAVRLKEAASRWFFQQLIIGLDYCHRRGVVNRDIKLENTLLQVGLAGHAAAAKAMRLEGGTSFAAQHICSEQHQLAVSVLRYCCKACSSFACVDRAGQ